MEQNLSAELEAIGKLRLLAIQWDLWDEYFRLVEYEKFLVSIECINVH